MNESEGGDTLAVQRQRPGTLTARFLTSLPLLSVLARREFRTRYRQSVLDLSWGFINPVVTMLVYGVIFARAFNVTGDGTPYLSFAWTGIVVWTFFATGLSTAMPSLIESTDLLSKIYFPREVIPLSKVGATLTDLGIGLITVVLLALVQGITPSPAMLAVVFPLALLVMWTAAIAMFGAVLTVFLRDVNHAIQLVLRVGFFATPVMYPPSTFGAMSWTTNVNPAAVCIEGVRDTLLRGLMPNWPLLAAQGLAATACFFGALAYTRAVESRLVDVV